MRALLAGAGARQALAGGGRGTVLAWFEPACYVELPAGLLVLTAPAVGAGPLYLCLDGPPPRLAAGAAVEVTGDVLLAGEASITAAGAVAWDGPLPQPAELLAGAAVVGRAAASRAHRSALLAPPYEGRAAGFRELLRAGLDLRRATALVGGLGPGLTPAGDDLLGGALFLLRAVRGATAERELSEVAGAVDTTPISGAFLRWAARGQALAPAHELLVAAAVGDLPTALAAAARMARVGETSGADFCLGMAWAAESLERTASGGDGWPVPETRPEP